MSFNSENQIFFFKFPFTVDKEPHILQLCSVRKMNGHVQ